MSPLNYFKNTNTSFEWSALNNAHRASQLRQVVQKPKKNKTHKSNFLLRAYKVTFYVYYFYIGISNGHLAIKYNLPNRQ